MPLQTEGTVINNVNLQSVYYRLDLHCPPIARRIRPGQFLMLKVSESQLPLLRRPFSVYRTDAGRRREQRERENLSILYKTVGQGTRLMSGFKKGQLVDLIGPLGNGFVLPTPSPSTRIVLIGGGVGIVSLVPLAEAWKGKELVVLIGGKTRSDILCTDDFKKRKVIPLTATEDGSLGFKGTVIELFRSRRTRFESAASLHIYACGPTEMLKQLSEAIGTDGIPAQVSLESRMGCGFGACWGCVVKTRNVQTPYQRVCKEGPVFRLEDLVWSGP